MAEQHFQIGVKGLIRNSKGELLMVHLPKWGHNPDHWDLPGGRMDPGETFLDTLKRELKEELGVTYVGRPKQLMGMLTNITIPVGDNFIPLIFIIYSTKVKDIKKIKLADDLKEDKLGWFKPKKAAELMTVKFTEEFCYLVSKL